MTSLTQVPATLTALNVYSNQCRATVHILYALPSSLITYITQCTSIAVSNKADAACSMGVHANGVTAHPAAFADQEGFGYRMQEQTSVHRRVQAFKG